MDPISVSFPVNPRPDGAAPVNRHNKSPIDATRVLIGRALVLMIFIRPSASLCPQNSPVCCFTTPLLPRPLSSLYFHSNKILREVNLVMKTPNLCSLLTVLTYYCGEDPCKSFRLDSVWYKSRKIWCFSYFTTY